MLDEYNPFSSDTTFLDQVISDLIDETIEARGIVPGGFEIEVSELTLIFVGDDIMIVSRLVTE